MNKLFCPVTWRLGEWLFYIVLSIGFLVSATGNASGPVPPSILSKPEASAEAEFSSAYGKWPLSFEVNRGQTSEQVKFLSRGNGYNLFLTPKEAVLVLRTPERWQKAKLGKRQTAIAKDADSRALNTPPPEVLRMQLVDANSAPAVVGEEELTGKSNYLLREDPKKWRIDIPHYARVRYIAVYPGIDLVYYGNQRQLEYDFVVAPGADPKTIRLTFEGADTLSLDKADNLVLQARGGKVIQHAPKVYQMVDGQREHIAARYILREQNQVSFQVASYDVTRPLVIDPVLSYSTYLGGSGEEVGRSITVDTEGNAYITGETSSLDFPLVELSQPASSGGGSDVFITKINPAGDALVYSTYLGGSDNDIGFSITVDRKGNSYLIGTTDSSDFPTVKPLQPHYGEHRDAFVAKLNAAGNELIYATYLGGSDNDYGNGIAVDRKGNAYVTGETLSTDFPTVNSLQSPFGGDFVCFVAKLNADGDELVYSTYLGGSDLNMCFAIAVDFSGNAYVTGHTQSVDFPTTASAFQPELASNDGDIFIAKLNSSGADLAYSTYLGGGRQELAFGIALDPRGNVYVTGYTSSFDFPTANPLQPIFGGPEFGTDAFLVKFNAGGTELIYSTYLGGNSNDGGNGISVDSRGNAYVTGITESTDFPIANAMQPAFGGGGDAFVSKVDAKGSTLIYSTFLGGSESDNGLDIALDLRGNAYVTGRAPSIDFPTTKDAVQSNFGGGRSDAFVAKIWDGPSDGFLFIEAESMAVSGGYVVEDNTAASGGQLIRRLDSGGNPATATTQYAGPAGGYDIAVSYFDEYDGMSSMAFLLNGEMLDQWIADEDPACRDCASPNERTLRSRMVARGVRLSSGDEIALQGTGEHYEYARFDKITLAPESSTTLEAEKMTLEGGYTVEDNVAASGGQLIRRLESGGYAATASTEFAGFAGAYDIEVSYFDEYDGMSSLAFLLNGEMLDQWIADEDPACRDCASPNERTLRRRKVASGVSLLPGDELALQGTGEHYEYARFDKITLASVGVTTLEAEMMTLDDGFVVEANAAASGGQIIRGNRAADSVPGQASAAFMGTTGTYDIRVTYFDEYDGISTLAVYLNDQLLAQWLADENPACRDCASPNEKTLRSRVVATGIEISTGDEIRLESTVNQYEYGRFDKIDFTPSL